MSDNNLEQLKFNWGCVVLIIVVILCITAYEIAKLFIGKLA